MECEQHKFIVGQRVYAGWQGVAVKLAEITALKVDQYRDKSIHAVYDVQGVLDPDFVGHNFPETWIAELGEIDDPNDPNDKE